MTIKTPVVARNATCKGGLQVERAANVAKDADHG